MSENLEATKDREGFKLPSINDLIDRTEQSDRKQIEVDEHTGIALDKVLDDDRQFFAEHPERSLRVRQPHPVEYWGLELTDDLPPAANGM
jgi:hypothetical protein